MAAEAQLSDYIQTFSGQKIDPLDINPDDICIEDIAHSLSLQCRWTGHTIWFYSVAEHSVRVSRLCDPDTALWGLLHDASEAFLVDLARPLKQRPEMKIFRDIEASIQRAIAVRFGLSPEIPNAVHFVDNLLLRIEYRDLMKQVDYWAPVEYPIQERITPWESGHAHTQFMAKFEELTGG